MEWEEQLREIASAHEGLIARFHLREIGCTRDHWRRARRNGRWEPLSPRVIRVSGAPESDSQRVLAAVLDASPGAILHGRSALAWAGVRGFNLGNIEVARPFAMSGTVPALSRLRHLRDLKPHHVLVLRGVPTEHPLRAIWSEAARFAGPALVDIGVEKIGRLLDAAHRQGLVTWAALHEMVDDIHQRGRSGTVIMRALAEARPPGSSPTESRNEEQLETILAEAGNLPLRRQVTVGGHEPVGRVDFCDPDLPLVVEVNSLTFHTTPSDRRADQVRYRRLNDAGFTVVVIWEDDLWANPAAVVRSVADGRGRTCSGTTTVIHSPGCPWPHPESFC